MAVKGQSTRDKFFLDFVAGATQSADPFGKQRQAQSSSSVDWLPELLFVETLSPASTAQAESCISEMKALFTQQMQTYDLDARLVEMPTVPVQLKPDFRTAG